MTFVGTFVKTFQEANVALAVGVHMSGDYEFSFDVVKVLNGFVTVKSSKSQKNRRLKIQKDGDWECFYYRHKGVYTGLFGGPAERVKVMPFRNDKE